MRVSHGPMGVTGVTGRTLLAVTLIGGLAGGLPAASAAPGRAAAPTMSVSPHAQLVGGRAVRITATGVTPLASVRINECEFSPQPDPELPSCGDLATTTADATGAVATKVVLSDPVYVNFEFGDPQPQYCRNDACQLFLAWTDPQGGDHVLASGPLQFRGSAAQIQ